MTRRPNIAGTLIRNRRMRVIAIAGAVCALAIGIVAGPAAAATSAAFSIDSQAVPTNFSAADTVNCTSTLPLYHFPICDSYFVTVTNSGARPTGGSPITVTDTLPPGLTVQKVTFQWHGPGATAFGLNDVDLAGYGLCSSAPVQCTFPLAMQPDDRLVMQVFVTVDDPSRAGTIANSVTASGGGATTQSTTPENTVGQGDPSFGPASFSSMVAGPDGQPDTQAGDHPYELSTQIDLTTAFAAIDPQMGSNFTSVENPKDIVVDLPLGLLGSAQATPTCTFAQFDSHILAGRSGCPSDTIVGSILSQRLQDGDGVDGPIYNMVPERGVAAEFAYADLLGAPHALYARVVPTSSGYVLQTTASDIPSVNLTSISTTFFGNPADQAAIETQGLSNPAPPSGISPAAMFTNPTDCSAGPLVTSVYMDSWQHPASLNADGTPNLSDPNWKSATASQPAVTGCNQLQFASEMSVQPDTSVADSPSGLHVDIRVPQSEDPGTLATPPLKDASVTLPPGFTVNPASAAGLGACSLSQIALDSAASPSCPDSSKIGTVQLTTPLLPGTLQGSIYLAKQFDNPFHSLVAGYVVVDDPATGVVIKIPGNLTPDPLTGQITGVFDNNPQFPFSELKLDFRGGPTGVLATPEKCGTYTTNALFSPWSASDSGPASAPSDSFGITSGCVSGFHPSFVAGTQNPQAGAYSPFVLTMSRDDQQENFQGLSVTLPPGMLAKLAGVQECPEADLAKISTTPGTAADEIANPSCPSGSQVGTVTTGAGVGPDPFFLDGKAYLTGPYKGAPYGLAVVVPALAGPFDLGTVVVREALHVNPTTAQVTDVSDPFPTILDGIPLRIRRVDVVLNRKQFTLNPTSCAPMSVTGTATSTQGTSSAVRSRFQVGGCASLNFSPRLSMKLTGKAQTKSGRHPNLVSVLTQKAGQTDIHNVQVALPLSLALDPNNSNNVCPYPTAQAVHGGAVGCPTSTIVGHATAITPLLKQPLTGNVYLVQGIRIQNGVQVHTLPSLLIPLRGQIALDLRAQTSVSHGKLVTTFPTIPDAPVTKFTLQITGGSKGILVITGRGRTICGSPQITQANLIAQNGKARYPNIKMSTPCVVRHRKHHKKHH